MPNSLIQLTYASKVNRSTELDMEQLLQSARKRNKAENVTGALWLHGKYFVQTLEGQRRKVSNIFCNHICADHRHGAIDLISVNRIDTRTFHDWSMAFLGDSMSNQQLILKYSSQDKFDPSIMDQKNILPLMYKMAEKQQLTATGFSGTH